MAQIPKCCEDESVMGKYSTLEQSDLEQLQTHGIIAIANELAEANRLERLRLLRLKIPYDDDLVDSWEKELEDRV